MGRTECILRFFIALCFEFCCFDVKISLSLSWLHHITYASTISTIWHYKCTITWLMRELLWFECFWHITMYAWVNSKFKILNLWMQRLSRFGFKHFDAHKCSFHSCVVLCGAYTHSSTPYNNSANCFNIHMRNPLFPAMAFKHRTYNDTSQTFHHLWHGKAL